MKTRREFLATTVAVAALLTNGSGQTAASLSGFQLRMIPDGEIQNRMT